MTVTDAMREAWVKVNAALDEHGDSPEYRAAFAEWERLARACTCYGPPIPSHWERCPAAPWNQEASDPEPPDSAKGK